MHSRAVGLLILVVALAYGRTLRNGFVWDDAIYIEHNPFVQDPANLRHLVDPRFYLGRQAVLAGSRPVFLGSLLIDRLVWGDRAWGWHLTNVLLHAADALWVYALGLELFAAWPGALAAALLFAAHPAASEAVNGVSFRTDLLAAFFTFAALYTYLRARRQVGRRAVARLAGAAGLAGRSPVVPALAGAIGAAGPAGRSPAVPALAGAIGAAGLFGLGLLAKESAASFLLLLPLAEFHTLPSGEATERNRRLAWALGLSLAAAAAFAAFHSARFRYDLGAGRARAPSSGLTAGAPVPALDPGVSDQPSPPPWREYYEKTGTRVATTVRILATYARLFVFPHPLVVDRAPPLAGGTLASMLLLAGLFAAALRWRSRPLGAGLAWCAAALVPVAGLYPLYNPIAERYLYLAAAGAAWALADLGTLLPPRARPAVLAAAVLALAGRAWARTHDWRSNDTLFAADARGVPQHPRVRLNRGLALWETGNRRQAEDQLRQAVDAHPGYVEAWVNLGMLRLELGRPVEALSAFERALELSPGDRLARYGRAIASKQPSGAKR
ncbi:MAG: tetratricopeptide repeat protein [Elusimicrobia bacterium]|nr:tetratricopeptide repeat protein [Elusimicrobiota bacterium]